MDSDQILKEVAFKAVRSSGAGGQHVNKVATKVILIFDLENSAALTSDEKEQLKTTIGHILTKDNLVIVQSADTRSQLKNRRIAADKLFKILNEGLATRTKRKKTKPTRASKEKRLKSKRMTGMKKQSRKRPDID